MFRLMLLPAATAAATALSLSVVPAATACPVCGCLAATTADAQKQADGKAAAGHVAAHAHDHSHDHPHAHSHDAPAEAAASGEPSRDAADEPPSAEATAPEADRRAILAMAGEFDVTFQFEETVAIQPDYELAEPYRSTASEMVEVIEDRGDFISLQHVLVVHDPDEPDAPPHVVKHWRQDWTYQDTDLLTFRGDRTWQHVRLSTQEVQGTWSQAVYQVDDSPRYEAIGTWDHRGERSAWESAETWRPLPRREFSKRSDYQVLVARNRHTLTPRGWVHEQDNRKLVLDDTGQPQHIIAHETGLNLYHRTGPEDTAAGRDYWQQTADYWHDVREIWSQTYEDHEVIALKSKVDDQRLHAALFALADRARTDGHSPQLRDEARQTVRSFLRETP